MIPDYQTLMRPVLEQAAKGETHISEIVAVLQGQFKLSDAERDELVPSGRKARFTDRVHWAKAYLKQAGLVQNKRRGYLDITDFGRKTLLDYSGKIDTKYLETIPQFMEGRFRTGVGEKNAVLAEKVTVSTPDEQLRRAHSQVVGALASEMLDRLRACEPAFFESVIVQLLVKMGYGSGKDAGQLLGQTGDGGVDGVINQDPLGVDQVFVQAKRYAADNNIGSAAIREFFGALSLKDVSKGIFVTTSAFTQSAYETAQKLNVRIVLIDGFQLAELMIAHEVGCRVTEVYRVSELDESFFE